MRKGWSKFLTIMSIVADILVKIFGRTSVPKDDNSDDKK